MCCTIVPSVILLSRASFRHPISSCEISPSPSSPLRACYLSSILPSVFFPHFSYISSHGLCHSASRLLRRRPPRSRLCYGKIMQEKTTMAISSYKRRFSSPLRLLFPPRHLSLVLHREVCLAWIRLLPALCGLYTFWTIARGNVLVHRKSWRYTTSKKNES